MRGFASHQDKKIDRLRFLRDELFASKSSWRKSVSPDLLLTFLAALEVLRPAFTAPAYRNMIVIAVGWIVAPGAITYGLVATGLSGITHHERFHRFLSRGTWDPDALGRCIFLFILRHLPDHVPLPLVVDDTLAPKKGPKVFGISSHLDAVRSTRSYKVFCFGHCWVVLGFLVKVPFSQRAWALPLLFRLYRSKKSCTKKNLPYRKKTQLAREMLDIVIGWSGSRRIELMGDSAYCNSTVIGGLPPSAVLIGDMRPDAVLTTLPPGQSEPRKAGRRRKRGDPLPKPIAIAQDEQIPWKRAKVNLYGYVRTVEYKDIFAQWYRACETRLLHIVVVKVTTGTVGIRVFFSTDAGMSAAQILQSYALRWAIEVTFRDLKQLFGFADSSARKQAAVERTAPFLGLLFSILVIWYVHNVYRAPVAALPIRPWYTHKRGHSFADILRAARRVLSAADIADLVHDYGNLQNPSRALIFQPAQARHLLE
jgi:hypothetical protein